MKGFKQRGDTVRVPVYSSTPISEGVQIKTAVEA